LSQASDRPPRSPRVHLTRVSTLSGPGSAPVSGQLSTTTSTEEPTKNCRGFLLPFGHRHSLLGSSCSRPGLPPSSRSAYPTATAGTWTGFPRSTPARYDREGCPLYPGDGGAHPGRMPCPTGACRFPTASPYTPLKQPTGGATDHEASTRVHAIHPSGLPLTCNPRVERGPSGFPSSFAPHRHQWRTSKAGPRREHAPGTTDPTPTSAGPPIRQSTRKE
jgi:hypothetical protein